MNKLITLLIFASLNFSVNAYALSAQCEATGEFASAMVIERDKGVTKKQALQKLRDHGQGHNKSAVEIINLVYSKQWSHLTEDGAYHTFGAVCEANAENQQ